MTKNYRLYIYIMAILSGGYLSCSPKPKDEKIISLQYAEYSGEIGKSFSILIKKDSVKLFIHRSEQEDSVVKARKIYPGEWEKILNSFSLEAFKSVEDGKSNAPVDGRDEIFTITTQANSFGLVNGSTDFLRYWRIRKMTNYLLHFKNGAL